MSTSIIGIYILHIDQYTNPTLNTVSPTNILVMCLHDFLVPISPIPMQVMTQIPTG